MSKTLNIIGNEELIKSKYPDLPFVVKDEWNDLWLIVYDAEADLYSYISLTCEDCRGNIGYIESSKFETLDDMFKEYPNDKIMNIELKITGEYKSE